MEVTVEQIANVPPRETARWLVRFMVIGAVLDEVRGEWTEGWGDGGQRLYYVAEEAVTTADITRSRDYQQEQLLSLSRLLPDKGRIPEIPLSSEFSHEETEEELAAIQEIGAKRRERFPESKKVTEKEAARMLRERQISRRLRYDAARAVGVIDEAGLSLGALSAYVMERADIHQAADRAMYDHEDEITNAVVQIRAGMRAAQRTPVEHPFKTLYGDGTASPDISSYERLWEHLAEFLAVVDAVASENS